MTSGVVAPATAGKVESAYAPMWALGLVAPEVAAEMDALGFDRSERYFASRSAPLGAVPLPVVVATFFNFSPAAVGTALPGAWDKATPAEVLDAQRRGVDQALTRAFADLDPAVVAEAAGLLRDAAKAASGRPEGRALFSAYSALDWPEDPHLVLWHAHYLLREFRGDGHIAELVAQGFTGAEALALHIATVPAIGPIFTSTRGWTDDEWADVLTSLRADGLLADGDELTLTDAGRERRDAIEDRTDELHAPAFESIGETGCERLLELAPPIRQALADAGLLVDFGSRPPR